MDRILRLGSGLGAGIGANASGDGAMVDTAEQVYISSLALLKVFVKLISYFHSLKYL